MGAEHEQDQPAQRPIDTRPLAEWKVDPVANVAVLVKVLDKDAAPERWLRWAAPYLDPALMDTWAPEPICLWSNIAGVLRCSERQARKLASVRCFEVDQADYRVKTSLREVWTCLSASIPAIFAQKL